LQPKIKQRLVTILVVVIILIVAVSLIFVGYRLNWTGFNGNNKSGKTLWDWLQLLIIPIILVVGGFLLNQIQNSREQRVAEKRTQTEREIASDTSVNPLFKTILTRCRSFSCMKTYANPLKLPKYEG